MKKMKELETITEIRKTRRKISEHFGHDPKRLVAFYMEKGRVRIQQGKCMVRSAAARDLGAALGKPNNQK